MLTDYAQVHTETVRKLALAFPCPDCSANVAEPCLGAHEEGVVHVGRIAPVWVIFGVGYRAGLREGRQRS